MEDNIQYKFGVLETQMTNTNERLDQLQKDVDEIKKQVSGWQNRATGAIVVLSAIGALVLKFADVLWGLFKIKVGS